MTTTEKDTRTIDAFKSGWGGYRKGAGRKQGANKKESVVMRVPVEHAESIKAEIKRLKEGGNDYSQVAQLVRTLAETEADAQAAIDSLTKQLETARQDNQSEQLRQRLNQLTSELYPALARLRELEPDAGW